MSCCKTAIGSSCVSCGTFPTWVIPYSGVAAPTAVLTAAFAAASLRSDPNDEEAAPPAAPPAEPPIRPENPPPNPPVAAPVAAPRAGEPPVRADEAAPVAAPTPIAFSIGRRNAHMLHRSLLTHHLDHQRHERVLRRVSHLHLRGGRHPPTYF